MSMPPEITSQPGARRKSVSTMLLGLAFVLLGGAAHASPRATACLDAPAPLTITAPERNLREIEALADAMKRATMGGFCAAVSAGDFDKAVELFGQNARVQRLLPQRERPVVHGAGTRGLLTAPADPSCFGDRTQFAADLRSLLGASTRVERCLFKPFRVMATRTRPRRANVDLHLWLGTSDARGARVSDKGDVQVTAEEDETGAWRFSRLEFLERERFEAAAPAFVDVTTSAGLPTSWTDVGYRPDDIFFGQVLYGGVSVGDYDGDGWSDLYISRAGPNLLLRNDGKGRFEDVSERAGVADPGNGQAALFVDFDNDGDQDLFVVNALYSIVGGEHGSRGHVVYRNDGGRFTEATRLGPIGPASGASAADYDGDGRVDVYVTYYQDEALNPFHHRIEARDGFGNRLYRNLGGLRFEDTTVRARVGGSGWSYASAWADFDEDGRIDLYVANDFGDNYLFRNRGDGTFDDVAARSGALDPANGMGVDWGDYDNDGHLDVYIANMYSHTGNQFLALETDLDQAVRSKLIFSVQGNSLYRNRGDGHFDEVGRNLGVGLAGWAWGVNFFDYDNDGWSDLHVANGFWAGTVNRDA
jgi:hypothetical protein